jgi:hypothetical protein
MKYRKTKSKHRYICENAVQKIYFIDLNNLKPEVKLTSTAYLRR